MLFFSLNHWTTIFLNFSKIITKECLMPESLRRTTGLSIREWLARLELTSLSQCREASCSLPCSNDQCQSTHTVCPSWSTNIFPFLYIPYNIFKSLFLVSRYSFGIFRKCQFRKYSIMFLVLFREQWKLNPYKAAWSVLVSDIFAGHQKLALKFVPCFIYVRKSFRHWDEGHRCQ